jgi:hypothetical protein
VPLATEGLLPWDESVDLIEHQTAHSRAECLGELAGGFTRKQLAVLGRRSHHYARRRQLSGCRWVALRDKAVKLFGILIFVSIFLTWFTYSKTFNSVWCFYCAVLSIFVIWIINRPRLSSRQAP